MQSNSSLLDTHGRRVSYLRVSITDRCNLHCSYCVADPTFTFIPHNKILTYEEILTLADAAVQVGIDKIRLTGGEPFARKGFGDFLLRLRINHPKLNIRITTNATLLEKAIPQLQEAKINALNISLDTFKAEKFTSITGKNLHKEALQGLMSAINSGLTVKLNCVALKGVNDDELEAFVCFAKDYNVDVRFIEHMPLGGRGEWKEQEIWSGREILSEASKYVTLTKSRQTANVASGLYNDNGPATMYSIAESAGRIGIISPVTKHFCGDCNRLRVTADGRLRTCLFSDKEYPLRKRLRSPNITIPEIISFLQQCLVDKPIGAELLEKNKKTCRIIHRKMSSIGG